jgi:hypothetical protein
MVSGLFAEVHFAETHFTEAVSPKMTAINGLIKIKIFNAQWGINKKNG